MSIDEPNHSQIAVCLTRRVKDRPDSMQIANEIITMCQEINNALTPIIGRRGVDALYKRSLYLAAPAYPWLTVVRDGAVEFMDLAKLKSTISEQSPADAAAGGGVLLQTFQDLLASLVGPSLTERLLHPVCHGASGSPPAQDFSP